MVLKECCGLEVEGETELQVEVEWVLVADCVERHSCDVMRELGCDVDAHIACEVILRSRSCVNRPLQSLDRNTLAIEACRHNLLDKTLASNECAESAIMPEVPLYTEGQTYQFYVLLEFRSSVVGGYVARHRGEIETNAAVEIFHDSLVER